MFQSETETEAEFRPSFRLHNRIYLSAGVTFYSINSSGEIYFLLQKKPKGTGWDYEDFGGKSQAGDLTIRDVAFRECEEEINGALGIKKSFLETCPQAEFLIPINKYAMYLVKLDEKFMKIDTKVFGECETLFSLERTVKWVSYRELFDMPAAMLHPRLQPEFKHWMAILLAEVESL